MLCAILIILGIFCFIMAFVNVIENGSLILFFLTLLVGLILWMLPVYLSK